MRTSNPTLLPGTFSGYGYVSESESMTVQGVVAKTGILLMLTLLTAGWTWFKFYQSGGNPNAVSVPMMIGVLGGFALAMVTVFKKEWAPATAVMYALLEGLFLGGISAMFEASFPGIVIQATALTFGTLFAMLAAYRTGLIQATEKFKLGVVAATGAIALFYFVAMILSFFGISIPFVYGGGAMGIAFSIFVVGIAALNLILDFSLIEEGAERNLPKYMEWYCSFALMVTLIWLYIEFLRLLSKARSR
jgi:uncharacterized YccA/Bax inhibitor family protein